MGFNNFEKSFFKRYFRQDGLLQSRGAEAPGRNRNCQVASFDRGIPLHHRVSSCWSYRYWFLQPLRLIIYVKHLSPRLVMFISGIVVLAADCPSVNKPWVLLVYGLVTMLTWVWPLWAGIDRWRFSTKEQFFTQNKWKLKIMNMCLFQATYT